MTGRNKNPRDRDLLVQQARGFISETADVRSVLGSVVVLSGIASYTAVGLYAEDKITNVTIAIAGSAAAGITLSKMGLYSSTGLQLAVTADQGTSWQTPAIKTMPFLSPYVVPATGVYYVGFLVVFTTTGPTVPRINGGNISSQFALAGKLASCYAESGRSDLPAQAVFNAGANVTGGNQYWSGLS